MPLLLFVLLLPAPASASIGTLDIRDDATGGECTTVGTWDWPAKTCTLTQDVSMGIIIEDDDVTLDCDGHTIMGSGSPGNGVYLPSMMGVTVKQCHVTAFAWGFRLDNSDGNTLYGNRAYDNIYDGFTLDESVGNRLRSNRAYSNDVGFLVLDSDDNTLHRNTAYNNVYGFYLHWSDGNTIRSNRAYDNEYGFYLDLSDGNNLRRNRAHRNGYGFYLGDSDDNTLTRNAGRWNAAFDALQDLDSTGNTWSRNRFGTTSGIP